MQGRYEVEDLLKLRASPLCIKPATLPPKEEWMGPGDSKPRAPAARGKEDSFSQSEGFQKRPTLGDFSRRSTTDPDRIHFGPPRHSFASSNKRNGTHERTKTNEDDDSKQTDRRSAGFAETNGRAVTKEDDIDSFDRSRRRDHEEAEADFRPRRDNDRLRWGPRDSQSDVTWGRRDKPSDVDDRDGPAWRRGGRDREYDRADAEPEWAESTETADARTHHTQADFKEWMEQMKKKDKGSVDTSSTPTQTASEVAARDTSTAPERPPARILSDSAASVDRFFAKFEEKKTAADSSVTAKPTKSRFASIFGSKEEPKVETSPAPPSAASTLTALFAAPAHPIAVELEQPTIPVEKEKKANDEAFAKLLQMLSKNQAGSAPAATQFPAVNTPVNISELAAVRSPESRSAATLHNHSNRTPVNHTPNLSLDRLIESRSPAQKPKQDQPAQHKATPQDLLDLLRRSNLQDKQALPQHSYPAVQEQRIPPPPPGLGNFPTRELDRQPPLISTRREAPRSIFDDPVFGGYRGEPGYQQRSPPPTSSNGLGNLFADMADRTYPQNNRDEQRVPMPSMVGPPPGLQRPPGLDGSARGPSQPPPGSGWPPPQQRAPMPQYGIDTQQPMYPQTRNVYPNAPQMPAQAPQQYPVRGDYGRYMQR